MAYTYCSENGRSLTVESIDKRDKDIKVTVNRLTCIDLRVHIFEWIMLSKLTTEMNYTRLLF